MTSLVYSYLTYEQTYFYLRIKTQYIIISLFCHCWYNSLLAPSVFVDIAAHCPPASEEGSGTSMSGLYWDQNRDPGSSVIDIIIIHLHCHCPT